MRTIAEKIRLTAWRYVLSRLHELFTRPLRVLAVSVGLSLSSALSFALPAGAEMPDILRVAEDYFLFPVFAERNWTLFCDEEEAYCLTRVRSDRERDIFLGARQSLDSGGRPDIVIGEERDLIPFHASVALEIGGRRFPFEPGVRAGSFRPEGTARGRTVNNDIVRLMRAGRVAEVMIDGQRYGFSLMGFSATLGRMVSEMESISVDGMTTRQAATANAGTEWEVVARSGGLFLERAGASAHVRTAQDSEISGIARINCDRNSKDDPLYSTDLRIELDESDLFDKQYESTAVITNGTELVIADINFRFYEGKLSITGSGFFSEPSRRDFLSRGDAIRMTVVPSLSSISLREFAESYGYGFPEELPASLREKAINIPTRGLSVALRKLEEHCSE